MNYRLVGKYLGHFSIALSLLMLPSAAWAVYFREWHALAAFAGAILVSSLAGGALALLGRRAADRMFQREALALVGGGWLLMAALGGLPYVMAGLLNPVDAYFESMSGFTTTGSTVLVNIEVVDKSILFWRSFTHWLGGMGIIVLFIAVLPYLGVGGKQLFKSETPGPDPRGLKPRIKDTAAILYKIYCGLTVLETALLMASGMNLFDALCHTFGTLATGGFSTRNLSVGAFNSVLIDIIVIVFMTLAGMNFGLHFAVLNGDWRAPFRNTEWRVYMAILAIAVTLVTLNLMGVQYPAPIPPPPRADGAYSHPYEFPQALRVAAFQVVSIMTTTGYCTDDFEVWPYFSRALLVLLMFIGGCAGSTGGGIKVVRVIMLVKIAYWQIESAFRPKTIRVIRVNNQVVEDDILRMVFGFFVLYVGIFAGGTVFMSLLGLPFQTALSSVAATLNNIGPGLELVGAVGNYAFIPAAGKVFLSVCMVLGRLELFSICVLFLPAFWQRS